MVANRWDFVWLTEVVEDVVTRHLEDLYTIKIQIPHAIEYLQSKMGEMQAWAAVFISSKPKVSNSTPLKKANANANAFRPKQSLEPAMGRRPICASVSYLT